MDKKGKAVDLEKISDLDKKKKKTKREADMDIDDKTIKV